VSGIVRAFHYVPAEIAPEGKPYYDMQYWHPNLCFFRDPEGNTCETGIVALLDLRNSDAVRQWYVYMDALLDGLSVVNGPSKEELTAPIELSRGVALADVSEVIG